MSLFFTRYYNILYVYAEAIYYYELSYTATRAHIKTQKRYERLDDAVKTINKRNETFIIDGAHPLVETETALHKSVLHPKDIVRALAYELKKDPSIGKDVYFKYIQIPQTDTSYMDYLVYGFFADDVDAMVESIETHTKWRMLTSPGLLLHAYLEKNGFKAQDYIAIYRHNAYDTMIVSLKGRLCLSRHHKQEQQEALEKFIAYARGRFKLEEGTVLYLGDFKNHDAKTLEPIAFEALLAQTVKLPKSYNLIPQSIENKHQALSLEKGLMYTFIAGFFLMIMMLFFAYGDYQKAFDVHEKVRAKYENTLGSLSLLSANRLEQLEYIADPKLIASEKKLHRFKKMVQPLVRKAMLTFFSYETLPSLQFRMSLHYSYDSLEAFDRFYLRFKSIKKQLKKLFKSIRIDEDNRFEKKTFVMTFIYDTTSRHKRWR